MLQHETFEREPTIADVRIALEALGGEASIAGLAIVLRQRHPQASGTDIDAAIGAAIRAGHVHEHEGLLYSDAAAVPRAPAYDDNPSP